MDYRAEVEHFLHLAVQADECGDTALSQAYLDSAEKAELEGSRAWALTAVDSLEGFDPSEW
jgi:hypothetical protein